MRFNCKRQLRKSDCSDSAGRVGERRYRLARRVKSQVHESTVDFYSMNVFAAGVNGYTGTAGPLKSRVPSRP